LEEEYLEKTQREEEKKESGDGTYTKRFKSKEIRFTQVKDATHQG